MRVPQVVAVMMAMALEVESESVAEVMLDAIRDIGREAVREKAEAEEKDTKLRANEKALIDDGKVIAGIKAYRTRTGINLSEAKRKVDAYRDKKNPGWRDEIRGVG